MLENGDFPPNNELKKLVKKLELRAIRGSMESNVGR